SSARSAIDRVEAWLPLPFSNSTRTSASDAVASASASTLRRCANSDLATTSARSYSPRSTRSDTSSAGSCAAVHVRTPTAAMSTARITNANKRRAQEDMELVSFRSRLQRCDERGDQLFISLLPPLRRFVLAVFRLSRQR